MSGPFTPIYLGNAKVDISGNFDLSGTVMYTHRFPADQSELVPRAYVDEYISSVVTYYNNILDPSSGPLDASGNKITTLDRLTYVEAQLSRVYKALWNSERNIEAINTPQLGSIAADYTGAGAKNAALIANGPVAPSALNGFQ